MIVLRPGFPRLTSEPQPGPITKFGTSIFGSVLFTPRASPPKPGVNGTPVLASKTPPISHPLRTHPVAPWAHFGAPISQVKFTSKLWATLKSARPRFILGLNHKGLAIEFEYSSPTRLPDDVSIVLPQV